MLTTKTKVTFEGSDSLKETEGDFRAARKHIESMVKRFPENFCFALTVSYIFGMCREREMLCCSVDDARVFLNSIASVVYVARIDLHIGLLKEEAVAA